MNRSALLTEIYGAVIPDAARRLDRYLRHGRLPLRDPDQPDRVLAVDLATTAAMFGADLADTDRHVHHLFAIGGLRLDHDGVVILDRSKASAQ